MWKLSSEYFVVKPKSARLPDTLPGKAAGTTGLFVFHSLNPDGAPRQQWDRLMHDYGEHLEFAAPIMIDDKGREMLPTGKVVVQFHDAPARDQLQRFATIYGLRFMKGNGCTEKQLRFQPVGSGTYLPDLIARLTSDDNVKLAALETMGRYSRL